MFQYLTAYSCRRLIYLTLFTFIECINMQGQEISTDNKQQLINRAKAQLLDTLTKQNELEEPYIIGRYHSMINNKTIHPYYGENAWHKGSLTYNGKTYNADNLKYDITTDNAIYMQLCNNITINYISLEKNSISEFTIKDKRFRFYKNLKNSNGKNIRDGYYEVVYDGEVKFLMQWEKTKSLSEKSYSLPLSHMYLLKGETIYSVKSKSMLLNLLSDNKRDAVKAFIKTNHLRFNKSDYSSIPVILNTYEKLMAQ